MKTATNKRKQSKSGVVKSKQITPSSLGKLEKHIPYPVIGKNFHVFIFSCENRKAYVAVAINAEEINSPGTRESPPELLYTKDLFHQRYIEHPNANITDEDLLIILCDILNTVGNKGYEVWQGTEGYRKHIWIEGQRDAINWFAIPGLGGKNVEPNDPHLHVKPYEIYEFMIEHYQERLAFRVKARNSKLLKPDGLVYIKNQIELSLIQEVEVEINYNLEKGRQLASNNWQIEPLTPVEHDTAKAFLKWLQNRKTEIEPDKSLIKKNNRKSSVLKTFQELFINVDESVKAIEALRKVTPPIVDEKGVFCLGNKSKGAMVAFIDVLKKRSKIQHLSESELAPVVNSNFPQLNITDRSLRNPGTRVYNRYYNELLALIN